MSTIIRNTLEFFIVLAVMFVATGFIARLFARKGHERWFAVFAKAGPGFAHGIVAVFGAITPFCVCTTIPVFTAMLAAGVRSDIALSFLFSSPLINISAVALIAVLFGAKFALYFTVATLVAATAGGVFARMAGLSGDVNSHCTGDRCAFGSSGSPSASVLAFKNLFVPLALGALVAGIIHNYVPLTFIKSVNHLPLAVLIPLLAMIGFPLYVNILALTPIAFSLVAQGLHPAAVMTFMMSAAGISLPTALVLSKIVKKRLFAYYLVYTFVSYCAIGFLFAAL